MKYIISGKNIELTEALKDYAQDKLNKLEKVIEGEIETTITMSTERNLQIVNVQVSTYDSTYRGCIEDKDMYAAIDRVVDILLGQIRKTKAKKDKVMKSDNIRNLEVVTNINVEKENVEDEIVKYITYSLKPIGIEDAKIILEESKDMFFTFVNLDTNKVNVIYRTKDNNFGIVEPNI